MDPAVCALNVERCVFETINVGVAYRALSLWSPSTINTIIVNLYIIIIVVVCYYTVAVYLSAERPIIVENNHAC